MTLAPFLAASAAIQVHVVAALGAFALGAVQMLSPKGTPVHRRLGRVWVAVMVLGAASSFLIHELRMWGAWSPIHLLSVITLVGLWRGWLAARRGDGLIHARIMALLFVFALIGAGVFALLPGRLLHQVVFG
ncbi:DUF2306 domain-containing protein [Azorhizobium sp. AG788]|uniref:DUF2306 domain-containing protein n=1 Tax=Azorhizobium sp. AG788 TaxID=2183897 RepID=UPI00313864C7